MKKIMTLLGASAVMFGTLGSAAEARKVYYEINGKRYSYSTNNRAQTAEARKRIEAAKAAEAAKAKADTEKASNPLSAAFGSQSQREAALAQARLQQVLSERGQSTTDSSSSRVRQADRRSRRTAAYVKEASAAGGIQRAAALTQEQPRPEKPAIAAIPAIAEPVTIHNLTKKVRSVSFDVESGIKTTIMVDGSIEEEPFDSSVLSQLAPEHGDGNSLMAFVKQLRKASPASPEEATGSIGSHTGARLVHAHPRLPRN